MDIPHDGVKMSLTKKGAGPSTDSPNGKRYAYWYGVEEDNGSAFDFVMDEEGHMAGSLVDMTNHNVLQFHSDYNGDYVVTVTPSSDFAPEIDPVEDEESEDDAGRMLRGRGTSSSFSTIQEQEWNQSIVASSPGSMLDSIKNNISQQAGRKLGDDLGGNMDILVVWTKEAECRNSNQAGTCTVTATTLANMETLIELAVLETNNGYTASGVDSSILLVHMYRHPTYIEPSFSGR